MSEPIHVSIIITSYNLGRFVPRAIESAFNQTQPANDIVVVNNGSTDDTSDVLATYGDRIRVVDVNPNNGVSMGRNAGAQASTGNWLLFLDADDELKPSAVQDLAAAAEDDPAGVVFGKVERYTEGTGEILERSGEACAGPPPHSVAFNMRGSIISTPGAAIIRRSLHDEIGGYEKLWQPTEDRDYWLKCGVLAPFSFCDAIVIRKYRRMDSTVRAYSDKAILWGMRVQIEFLEWCQKRNIDTAFLREFSPPQIAREAIQTALRRQDWPMAKAVSDYAREQDIRLPLRMRAHARVMFAYYRFRQWTLRGQTT